jgi:DNA polymerase-3 subunit alpha
VVLVRGKVDHKDRDKTCLVAQQLERFDPTPEEVREAAAQEARGVAKPSLLRLRLVASALGERVLGELKDVLAGFPGESEVIIELATTTGDRKLKLGPDFRVTRSAALHAELEELLGVAMVREDGSGGGTGEPATVEGDDGTAAATDAHVASAEAMAAPGEVKTAAATA